MAIVWEEAICSTGDHICLGMQPHLWSSLPSFGEVVRSVRLCCFWKLKWLEVLNCDSYFYVFSLEDSLSIIGFEMETPWVISIPTAESFWWPMVKETDTRWRQRCQGLPPMFSYVVGSSEGSVHFYKANSKLLGLTKSSTTTATKNKWRLLHL